MAFKQMLQDERGASLVMTVMVLAVVLTFVTFLMTQAVTLNLQSHASGDRTEAEVLSHTGADHFESVLVDTLGDTPPDEIEAVALPADYTHNYAADYGFEISEITLGTVEDDRVVKFISTGIADARTVETEHSFILE